MLTFIKFDDEDTYYPSEYRIDDISKWLAETLTEAGLKGTFCLMGKRVKLLQERERRDVLDALGQHDLISHQMGNAHPELVDLLAGKDWEDGLQAVRKMEDAVSRTFKSAFGREPQGLSRHNVQWGAQHVALAGLRDIPYLSTLSGIPDCEQPIWYAGALCLPVNRFDNVVQEVLPAAPMFRIHETIYSSEEAFDRRLKELERYVDECVERDVEVLYLFAAHPSRISSRGFLETRCLANGQNRSPQEVGFLYGVLDEEQLKLAQQNFRRFCEFVRDHPQLECKGISEIAQTFSNQPKDITRDEMTLYADKTVLHNATMQKRSFGSSEILLDQTFSPAELFIGMVESLIKAGDGDLPNKVNRRDLLGPMEIPVIGIELTQISHNELLELCRKVIEHVITTGHLPANITNSKGRIGVGQLMLAVVQAYSAQTHYSMFNVMNLGASVRYPAVAWDIDSVVRRLVHEMDRFDPNLGSDKLAKHARLQTWTLKPAWLSPPRAKYCHEGRISFV